MSENSESPPSNSSLVRMFDAEDIGASLQEVSVDLLQKEGQTVESRWFHSNKDADLYFWKDQKQRIIKQQVTFYGQFIERDAADGLRTGLLVEDVSKQDMGSPLLRYDSKPQGTTVEQGIDIVGHVPGLKDQDKIQIIKNFAAAGSIEKILRALGLFNKKK